MLEAKINRQNKFKRVSERQGAGPSSQLKGTFRHGDVAVPPAEDIWVLSSPGHVVEEWLSTLTGLCRHQHRQAAPLLPRRSSHGGLARSPGMGGMWVSARVGE